MSDPPAPVADVIEAATSATGSIPSWLGPVLGGTVLSAVSAAGSFGIEKTIPTPKTLGRDFILGAIFFMLISQLLPESTGKLIAAVIGFFAFSFPSSASGVSGALLDEMEVRVGVPQF
jgi:hypothetical protein